MKTINTGSLPTECPSDHQLHLYVEDALDDAARLELDNHIDECELCSEVLVALAELLAPESSPSTPVFAKVIARYQIVKLLGKGGMGAVYEGYDPQLQRSVALKVIRPDAWGDGDEALLKERMEREARALAGISHPHILPVYESGEWEGELYIAMQLVQGEDLRLWLVRQQPLWSDIVSIFQQAAKGLHAAHQAGIIHRDIKPDNFLITQEHHVYLADFGLVTQNPLGQSAQHQSADALLKQRLTRTGMVVGTHGYLAPELYRGQPADARSDQFAFCVSLYEALYQQMPHNSLPLAEHLKAIESGELKKPMVDDVPPGFYGLLERGMHPIPSKRFASMELLRSEMMRLLEHEESSPTLPEHPIHESLQEIAAAREAPLKHTRLAMGLLLLLGSVLGAFTVLLLARPGVMPPSKAPPSTPPTKGQQTLRNSPSPPPRRAALARAVTTPRQLPRAKHRVQARAAHNHTQPPSLEVRPTARLSPRMQPTARKTTQQKRTALDRRRTKARRQPKLRRPISPKRRPKQHPHRWSPKRRASVRPRRLVRVKREPWELVSTPRRRLPVARAFPVRRPRRKRRRSRKPETLQWWMSKMPYKKANHCERVERRYKEIAAQGMNSFRNTRKRSRWMAHINCLFKASQCHQAIRALRQYYRITRRGNSDEYANQDAYKRAALYCPAHIFLGTIAKEAIIYMEGIGPYRRKGSVWCRRYVSQLLRKWRRFQKLIRQPRYKKQWKKLIWAGVSCSYQRALSTRSRTVKRSTCHRMLQDLHRLRTSLRQQGIARRTFNQRFSACQGY